MWRSRSSLRTSDQRLELEVGFCWCVLLDIGDSPAVLGNFDLFALLQFSAIFVPLVLRGGVAGGLTPHNQPASFVHQHRIFHALQWGSNSWTTERKKEYCVTVFVLTPTCSRADAVMEHNKREGRRERKIQKSLLAGQMMSPETLAVWGSSLFPSVQRWAFSALRDQCSTFTTLKDLHFALHFTFMDLTTYANMLK